MRRTGIKRLGTLVEAIRRELFPESSTVIRRRVEQKSIATEVRTRVVTKLVEAIEETDRIAKQSAKRTKAGRGGVSPKERWYQLMGYLAQVLDGVLRNFELESVKQKMDLMEMTLDELQRTTPTAG